MSPRSVVFLNPGATYGTGRERWERVESEVARRLGEFDVEETRPLEETAKRVAELTGDGVARFVAAGGDGTVNLLVNALMALPEGTGTQAGVTLGAVGLGSSNDFHKPYGAADTIEGMPVHVDFDGARERDVIRIDYHAVRRGSEERSTMTRHSLVNASIGVTAEANARFNDPNWVVRAVRPLSVDAAITAAVVTTLICWEDVTCVLSTDGREHEMASVTSLSVYKNPHFGGELCYDLAPERDDGILGVALCEGMTTRETLRTLKALRERSFDGPKTRSWKAKSLVVSGDREFSLETDGEVVRASGAEFSVAEKRIRCCV